MMKTLTLALAVASLSLAGCADDAAEETDTVIVEPTAPVVTEPMDDMSMEGDSTMMEGTGSMEGAGTMEGTGTMSDSAATGTMEGTGTMSDSTSM